ncbi:MAG: zinc-ribbon and DUF3426 domain-containing protein [Candidatus Nitrotoga sp.]
MSTVTYCPQCKTEFQVTQEQLEVYQGMVRCGQCQTTFHADAYLHDKEPSPQLTLPILQDLSEPPVLKNATGTKYIVPLWDKTLAETIKVDLSNPAAWPHKGTMKESRTGPHKGTMKKHFGKSNSGASTAPYNNRLPEKSNPVWLGLIATLMVALLAQTVYFFRVEIAARLPGLKPAFIAYCELLQCSVPLPQEANQMSIESSDLEAHPVRAGVVTLNVILRNRASYAQAYPHLELTLTDTQDQTLARRTFSAAEYLKFREEEINGLAANRESSIKLYLDTNNLKAAGYKLFLFYPNGQS